MVSTKRQRDRETSRKRWQTSRPCLTGDYELKKAWPASGPVHANSAPGPANSIIPGPQSYRSLRRRRSPDGTAVLSSIRDSGVLQGAFTSQPAPPPPRSRENRRRICLSGRQWPECLSVQTDGRASSRTEEHTSELQSLMRISYAIF